jgi:hypothetical protein
VPPDPDAQARTIRVVAWSLTAAGIFAIVADVLVEGYAPPAWIGTLVLGVAGGALAKAGKAEPKVDPPKDEPSTEG